MAKAFKSDGTRERRIENEIVVDCYTPEGCAMGWLCYHDRKRAWPFTVRRIAEHTLSPLTKSGVVEVLRLAISHTAITVTICSRPAKSSGFRV